VVEGGRLKEETRGVNVIFGEGTDDDTWYGVFGHLTVGYTIEVNGVEGTCSSTYSGDGAYGLEIELEDGTSRFFPWHEIERVVIF
jgi:hypothetical protein